MYNDPTAEHYMRVYVRPGFHWLVCVLNVHWLVCVLNVQVTFNYPNIYFDKPIFYTVRLNVNA